MKTVRTWALAGLSVFVALVLTLAIAPVRHQSPYLLLTRSGYDGSELMRAFADGCSAVIVTVGADQLDAIGVVMDFHVLERRLRKILAPFDSHHLNDVEPFTSLNPSAENVAGHIARSLKLPARVRLVAVEAWETPSNRAKFTPSL